MSGLGTILGILIGIGAVITAFTNPAPNVTVVGALLFSLMVGAGVFLVGLLLPMFTGTASMGVMLGLLIAGIVYAFQTEWAAMTLAWACTVTILVAQMAFGAVRGPRQGTW
jgi:hypothetical protein